MLQASIHIRKVYLKIIFYAKLFNEYFYNEKNSKNCMHVSYTMILHLATTLQGFFLTLEAMYFYDSMMYPRKEIVFENKFLRKHILRSFYQS
jgi:hypothetical protein